MLMIQNIHCSTADPAPAGWARQGRPNLFDAKGSGTVDVLVEGALR